MFEPDFLRALGLSLIPGLFWLSYLRSLSQRTLGPGWWLWAFLLGVASTWLTLALSEALQVTRLLDISFFPQFAFFVLGVGMLEEFAKAAVVIVGLLTFGKTRHPLFALQLSGAVALGFATWENVYYALGYGTSVLIGRGLLSTLGHVLMSSVWGSTVSRLGESPPRPGLFLGALLLGGFGHGLYNWFLVTGRAPLAVITLIVLWLIFRQAVVEAALVADYGRRPAHRLAECLSCRSLTRAEGRFCTACGTAS